MENADVAEQALRAALPPIAERTRPGVRGGVRSELAVELGEERNTVGEAKLGAGRGQRGVFRQRRAVDDEARARKRLEYRRQRRIAHPIVCPGNAPAQRQHRIGIDRQNPVEARAQLAPGVGRVAGADRISIGHRNRRWLSKPPA